MWYMVLSSQTLDNIIYYVICAVHQERHDYNQDVYIIWREKLRIIIGAAH